MRFALFALPRPYCIQYNSYTLDGRLGAALAASRRGARHHAPPPPTRPPPCFALPPARGARTSGSAFRDASTSAFRDSSARCCRCASCAATSTPSTPSSGAASAAAVPAKRAAAGGQWQRRPGRRDPAHSVHHGRVREGWALRNRCEAAAAVSSNAACADLIETATQDSQVSCEHGGTCAMRG